MPRYIYTAGRTKDLSTSMSIICTFENESVIPVDDVIPFKKKPLTDKHKGNTLCKRGFHKWQIDKEQQFDSKQGKLVTLFKCKRCGKIKSQLL